MINKRLSNLSIHKSVLNILNIKTPINYKTFTEEDDPLLCVNCIKLLLNTKQLGIQTHKTYLRSGLQIPLFSLTFDLLSLTVTLVLGNAFFITPKTYIIYQFQIWEHKHSCRFGV